MTKFTVYTINSETKMFQEFLYDNETSSLFDTNSKVEYPTDSSVNNWQDNLHNYNYIAKKISKDLPAKKTKDFQTLKISFGMKCNYSCEYCSQRFVPEAEEQDNFDADEFLNKLTSTFNFGDTGKYKKIEYWGGEPLVYWNKIVAIAEKLREQYPDLTFGIITNGSLMTKEKADWLVRMGFTVGMSHDGPGQSVRGPNPFDVEKIKENILYLYNILAPQGRMSFNSMLNNKNTSRKAIQEYFVSITGDEHVQIGEGGFIDAYDMGGYGMSLNKNQFKQFSYNAFKEIRQSTCTNFIGVRKKIVDFLKSLYEKHHSKTISQKCGMDKEYNIVVDLNGDILTCQNVTSAATAPNGNPHKIGTIDDFDNIKLTTATHWSHREECKSCPVLHLCRGSCMFLEGELWKASCNNAFYDNIPYFCAVIEHLTNCIPVYIDGDLPEERKDIFGLFENGFDISKLDIENFYKELECQ